jgi:2-oxoglutarate dehydrogenase E2 component (dihydrolipoamide succinyltransferase)
MPVVELIMPKMGESIMEATILKWLKKEGDTVEADESVLEIATDKVDSEVPASLGGVITKILFNEGDVVAVGKAVALIDTGGNSSTPQPAQATEAKAPAQAEPAMAAKVAEPVLAQTQEYSSNGSDRFYSPLVMSIAREEKISMSELEKVPGSGKDQRVTKADILAYLQNRGSQPAAALATQPVVQSAPAAQPEVIKATAAPISVSGNVEIVEMDRMRKLIADHMVRSKHTSPHVTSFVEADVTELVLWRNKVKDGFQKRENEKITFTPIFIEAVAKALKEFPYVNSSVDGSKIIVRKDLNIGMATALPSGNLIVPVIKGADQLSLTGITKQVNRLADSARKGKLKPEDIEGGTFTISNVGTFGNLMGTPIINQPQVAILATGVVKKKPVVLETPSGDVIAIRHMMFLSLSYDHRIVDGAMGGSFLRRIADLLEQFDGTREI